MEVICSMKILVTTYMTTQCHNPEDHSPHKVTEAHTLTLEILHKEEYLSLKILFY
jgi:hypothetical protein